MDTEKRTCLECHDILRGRADQKFCSDACRNTFNNRANSDSTALIRNINNALRRNRRILMDFSERKKTKLSRELLFEKGFSFHYYTHIYTTKKGATYHFCYDYGYLLLDDGKYFIVKDLKE
jgi:hypothetical protein